MQNLKAVRRADFACYKSYVGCSTDFEKTIDELRKRKFCYVLQQISATWENASITPGRKRATKFS